MDGDPVHMLRHDLERVTGGFFSGTVPGQSLSHRLFDRFCLILSLFISSLYTLEIQYTITF